MQNFNFGKIQTVAFIIGAILVIFMLYKVLMGLGLIKSKTKKEVDKSLVTIRQTDIFNPNFHKEKNFRKLSDNEITVYAKDLRKAIKGFGTNEELIYSTFKKFWNKLNISQVAEKYYLLYKRDLRTDILNDLNSKEVNILMGIINTLPNSLDEF